MEQGGDAGDDGDTTHQGPVSTGNVHRNSSADLELPRLLSLEPSLFVNEEFSQERDEAEGDHGVC